MILSMKCIWTRNVHNCYAQINVKKGDTLIANTHLKTLSPFDTLWILRLFHFVAWKVLFHDFLRLYHFHWWQHNERLTISTIYDWLKENNGFNYDKSHTECVHTNQNVLFFSSIHVKIEWSTIGYYAQVIWMRWSIWTYGNMQMIVWIFRNVLTVLLVNCNHWQVFQCHPQQRPLWNMIHYQNLFR